MAQVAKVFINGRSQAVRLPAAYRFDTKEVFVRRDPETGDVVLSRRPVNWDSFLAVVKAGRAAKDFLNPKERNQGELPPDPFEDWRE